MSGRRNVRATLSGRTIVVTRPADQASILVKSLDQRGARVLVAPTIEIAPIRSAALTAALRELTAGHYAWLTLTSRATVDMLADRLASAREVRAEVAVIGDGTAAAFRRWSRREPDLPRLHQRLGDQQVGRGVRLPRGGVMLADPGFGKAQFVGPAQRIQVPAVAIIKAALGGVRRHREQTVLHRMLLLLDSLEV